MKNKRTFAEKAQIAILAVLMVVIVILAIRVMNKYDVFQTRTIGTPPPGMAQTMSANATWTYGADLFQQQLTAASKE